MNEKNYIQQFRESCEFANKNFLFFINTSLIICYIAGALVIQIPFINTFGIISYDYKAYLLVGVIIFIFIQIATFISHFFEVFLYEISEKIIDLLFSHLKLSINDPRFPIIAVQLVIFGVAYKVIPQLLEVFPPEPFITEYSTLIKIFFRFFGFYLFGKLFFNSSLYNPNMNYNKFLVIVISLALTISIEKTNIEPFLLTDAILLNGSSEQQIEVLYLDDDNLYYKIGDKYKYILLTRSASVEFSYD